MTKINWYIPEIYLRCTKYMWCILESYLRVTWELPESYQPILKPISLSSWLRMLKDCEWVSQSVSQSVSEIIECRAAASQLKIQSTGKLRLSWVSRFDSHGWNENFWALKFFLGIHLWLFLNFFFRNFSSCSFKKRSTGKLRLS